ncbi:MAG: DoxX family membrane protein [Pedobacter sp.]
MKNKILFIVCLLFGLMFINAGLNKFLNYMPVPTDLPESMMKVMGAFMQITWLMPLVGIIEILGGILIMIPKYRALGSIIILPVMVGILLLNIFDAPSGLPIALVLLAINIWVIIDNRSKFRHLIN